MSNAKEDIWLKNSHGEVMGCLGVTAYSSDRKGFITLVMGPASLTIDLTPEQLHALAFHCSSVAQDIEIRELTQP